MWGETGLETVWADLAELLGKRFGGLHIRRCLLMQGSVRKKEQMPEHRV